MSSVYQPFIYCLYIVIGVLKYIDKHLKYHYVLKTKLYTCLYAAYEC